jgi:hypothetical protein
LASFLEYLFVQPLKYDPVFKNRIIVCFTAIKKDFNDEKCEFSKPPSFSFRTNDINDSRIGNAGSWRMVFNSEYIENENRHLSEEVVEIYEIRKYKDLKNQKEFYISHQLENLNEVLTEPCFNGIVLTLVDVVKDDADNLYEVNPNPVIESFKADFNQLKLNSVDFIRAYASVYSYLYKNNSEFYTPLAYICQCSGSGKSKSATTVLKETPGFYVCLRNPDRDRALLLVPKANLITNAYYPGFEEPIARYFTI